MPMAMAALAGALSLLDDRVVVRGGVAASVVVAVGELVVDAVVGDEDAEDEVGGAGEENDGGEIPIFEDRLGAVELEALVDKLVILGPHVCGDMASFDVIVKTGCWPNRLQ